MGEFCIDICNYGVRSLPEFRRLNNCTILANKSGWSNEQILPWTLWSNDSYFISRTSGTQHIVRNPPNYHRGQAVLYLHRRKTIIHLGWQHSWSNCLHFGQHMLVLLFLYRTNSQWIFLPWRRVSLRRIFATSHVDSTPQLGCVTLDRI